jgi:dihydrolipoamide dehydrogenase
MSVERQSADVVVLGAGPGGYAAALYAADLGRRALLIDQDARLGGVCLTKGCIPSKALLHATEVMREARELSPARGIAFGEPAVRLEKLRAWKEGIIDKLSQGVAGLASRRGVTVLRGRGHFEDSTTLRMETEKGQQFFSFERAIIAVGSKPAMPKAFDLGNRRIMTSTEALELEEVPKHLLVVGGGYIGLELGTVYATLGSRVTLIEALDAILQGVDADLARPVRAAQQAFASVRVSTKVLKMATSGRQIKVVSESNGKTIEELYDRVLVAVGRAPNCDRLGLEHTGVRRDDKGFIRVNAQQQTDAPAIYAIGDVVGGAMLAHKASKEARVAVEAIAGEPASFEDVVIPAVVFTDPEVAWCGLTETEAREKERRVEVVKVPWSALGRPLTFDRTDGLTKLVVDPDTERILGVGIVGVRAGDLISEGVLAVEMGATARDVAESVHPHPTLSETLMECAELFYGTATHTSGRRRRAEQPAEAA